MFLFSVIALVTACSPDEPSLEETLTSAQEYFDRGDIDAAVMTLEAHRARDPGIPRLLETLAFVYASANDHTAAAFAYVSLYEVRSDLPENLIHAARHMREGGDLLGSADLYRRYLDAQPNDATAWRALAEMEETAGRFNEAITAYTRLYQLDPRPETAAHLGVLFHGMGNEAQAEEWYTVATNAENPPEEALVGSFRLKIAHRAYEAAEKLLSAIRLHYPTALEDPALRLLEGEFNEWRRRQMIAKELTDALGKNATQSASPEPDEPSPASESSVSDESAGASEDTAGSVTDTEPEIFVAENPVPEPIVPGNADQDALLQAGAADADQAQPDEGEPDAEVSEDSGTLNAAVTEMQPVEDASSSSGGDPRDSRASFATIEKTVSSDPRPAPSTGGSNIPILEQARALKDAGDTRGAIARLHDAITANDRDAQVWYELSDAYFEIGDYAWAEATALEAVRREPDNLRYTLQFLRVAQRTLPSDRLLQELIQAHERFPDSPDIVLALARAYRDIARNTRNAAILYDRFLIMAPDHPQKAIAERELQAL